MTINYEKVSLFTQIPDYTTLQELVQEFLNRTDQGTIDMIPLFINTAEKSLFRNFRIPAMEITQQFVWGDVAVFNQAEDGWIYIPSDYLEMRDMWDSKGIINRVPYSELLDRKVANNSTDNSDSEEHIYARSANRWHFHPIPAKEELITLVYYQDPAELSTTTETTVLLDLAPDAILYMSVAEGHKFLMEEDKAEYWEKKAIERIDQIELQAQEAEYSGGVMQISPPH